MVEHQKEQDSGKTARQKQVEDPNSMEQQSFQPESGSVDSQEEKQARRRSSIGTERVKLSPGEATEEA